MCAIWSTCDCVIHHTVHAVQQCNRARKNDIQFFSRPRIFPRYDSIFILYVFLPRYFNFVWPGTCCLSCLSVPLLLFYSLGPPIPTLSLHPDCPGWSCVGGLLFPLVTRQDFPLLPGNNDLIDFQSIKFLVIFLLCVYVRILCKSFVRMSHKLCVRLCSVARYAVHPTPLVLFFSSSHSVVASDAIHCFLRYNDLLLALDIMV